MIHSKLPRDGRHVVFDPDKRRRLHREYFPWLHFDLLADTNEPFRAECARAALPHGHVFVSADSHVIEVVRKEEQPRISFRLIEEGVTQATSAANRHVDVMNGECLVSRHHAGERLRYGPGRRSVFTVDEAAIRNFVERRYEVETPREIRFGEVYRLRCTQLAQLTAIFRMIIWAGTRERAVDIDARHHWQDTLMAWVVENVPHNFKTRLTRVENFEVRLRRTLASPLLMRKVPLASPR